MKRSELFFAFILLPVDIAMIIASFFVSYVLRSQIESVPFFAGMDLVDYLRYSMYLIPVWILMFAAHGLYYIKSSRHFIREFYKIFSASSISVLILIVVIFLSKTVDFSRIILVFIWLVSILFISFGRICVEKIQKFLLKYGIGKRNVLLIGDNSTSLHIAQTLAKEKNSGYKVSGILNGASPVSKYGLKIIGTLDNLKNVIADKKIDEVIVTDMGLAKSKVMNIIQACSDRNVTFKYIPDLFSLITFNVSSELIGSMPVMELKPIPLDGWGRITKRITDIFFSLLVLILLSPLLLLIAILEKITSKGPILYSHERIGRDNVKFFCHKFRSFYTDKCDFKGKGEWSTQSDEKDKITPLGKFLRKSNFDELPQFWNILVGQMSFVGPRPEQPKLVEKFAYEIPEYFKRHRVKAGLTGWAQVNGLKGDTSISERVKYDIYYIENWSLWLDIKIIFKTVGLIIDEILHGKSEYRARS